MSGDKNLDRRSFLAKALSSAGAVGFGYVVSPSALGGDPGAAASNRISIGLIGLGSRGTDHLKMLLPFKTVQIVAVCDVFRDRREQAKRRVEEFYGRQGQGGYKGCDTYNDFREVVGRQDIDAVVVATPEHWHVLHMIAAVRAGKDVYGEKALSLTVEQGRALVDAVRKNGRVFQVGTQQRSDKNFRHACELARNGYLGKVHTVKVGVPGGHKLPYAPPAPVPRGLDYDMWLGPAPEVPYDEIRTTSPDGWYHIYDYCAGWIESWGVHHMDIALWGMPSLGESQIEVEGTAVFPTEGLGNTSLTWNVDYVTPDGLRCSFTDDAKNRHGCRFEGDKGWVHVTREGIWAQPETLLAVLMKPDEVHLYESRDHHQNFLECVKSRRDPAAPVEAGHAATSITLVADIATRLNRKLKWDWRSEKFLNDDEANKMLSRTMRSPWTL